MIYKFRAISDENENFFCDVEIKADQKFYDLHYVMQYEAGWDSSQLASFFISDNNWARGTEISLIDLSGNTLLMDKVKLSKYYKKPKEKLLYVFDIMSDRALFLQLESVREYDEDDDRGKEFPVIVNGAGEFPSQILGNAKKKAAQSRDIFEEEEFDDVELRGGDAYPEIKEEE